jgi:ribosomal protein S18 acetylase RimI-like enzyme
MSAPLGIQQGIVVRHARHQDLVPVGEMFLGLSPESRYHRFLSGIRYLSLEQKRNLVTISARQVVLLALDGGTVVGHILARFEDERTVGIALAVADRYKRRGIGKRLVHELAETLAASGVTEVCVHVQAQNEVVMDWLRRLLTDLHVERSRDTLTVSGSFQPRVL